MRHLRHVFGREAGFLQNFRRELCDPDPVDVIMGSVTLNVFNAVGLVHVLSLGNADMMEQFRQQGLIMLAGTAFTGACYAGRKAYQAFFDRHI